MEKFYSNITNGMIQQVNKTKARNLYNQGKTIYFQSSNLKFNCVWQSPMAASKDGYSFQGYTFDQVCNNYEVYNCDKERGKYIHFYDAVEK